MTERNNKALGLPFIVIVGLALLAVPRVIMHDLNLISEGTFVNLLFVVVPTVVWILVVVLARVPNPFLTLLMVGLVYGIFLALTHQLLWDANWGDNPPALGGNLGNLPPLAESLILRGFATVSSVFTGVIVGVVTGLIAWGISILVKSGRARR